MALNTCDRNIDGIRRKYDHSGQVERVGNHQCPSHVEPFANGAAGVNLNTVDVQTIDRLRQNGVAPSVIRIKCNRLYEKINEIAMKRIMTPR
jgi:hypothetical protein